MTEWFTSDLHLGHANIIKYSNRPFMHVGQMNEELIRNFNAYVQPKDDVFILGDLALASREKALWFASRLQGKKHLVYGNHDKSMRKHYEQSGLFEWCKDYAEISPNGVLTILSHFPFLTWNKSHHGSYHLHGHCHGSLPVDKTAHRMDVGVDPNNYIPLRFEEIDRIMQTRKFKPVDHHDERAD